MPKILLEALNIEKYYADKKILSFDSLKIYSGDKIGVIGANGSGKTTLLNILSGELAPDCGTINHYCEISYIRQFEDNKSILEKNTLEEQSCDDIDGITLSGGEKTKLKIETAFYDNNMLIFADEPTSNLDIKSVEFFCSKLEKAESFILISHDRSILDRLCNKTIEINNGKLEFYSGNYSFYLNQRENKKKTDQLKYENYREEKARLERTLVEKRSKAKAIRKAPARMGNSEARLHKGKTSEKEKKLNTAASNIRTRLEKLEVQKKPVEHPKIKMDFSLTDPPANKIVIHAENLSFSYGQKAIFNGASFDIHNGTKVALYGENGSGKTTLLNLIAEDNPKINVVPKAKIGYFYQGFENINFDKTVLENAMTDSIQTPAVTRTVLARLLIAGDNVHKPASVLSGGERIKLSFAKLLVSDANILLLDEPTNYLDMLSIETLQNLLCEYEGTAIFVSHDSEFVNALADKLIVFKNKKLISFDGNIKTYENSISNQKNSPSVIEKTILQMKLTEIISKLSNAGVDKEALEEEYASLLKKLKSI